MTNLDRRAALGALAGATAGLAYAPAFAQAQAAQPSAPAANGAVPSDWVDPKTNHRIVRLSGDEGGGKLYFYRQQFTPEGDLLVYSTPQGITAVNLATRARRVIVADPRASLMFTSRRNRTAFYYISDEGEGQPTDRPRTLYAADIDSGESRQVGRIEAGQIWQMNADETLMVGTVAYGDAPLQPDVPDPRNRRFGQAEYSAVGPDGKPLNFAKAKGVRMLTRWAARVPMELFVLDLRTGERRVVHKANDWLNHAQFSPTDPDQLIFSHEGPWHRVTRMWRIRTDGTGLAPLHERTMNFEIWGHEFFGPDGQWLWYDLQTPRGQVFWVAGLELATGRRMWRRIEQNDWSVHFNVSPDGKLFAGDGGDADMVAHAPDGKWIVALRPETVTDAEPDTYQDDLVTPEYMRSERLVDMSAHDYRLEPNITFTPDGKWIVFGSNMHGSNHVYMVEVAPTPA
ncbi:oligogalacturonate lyase family protein [Croceibacterium sp. TMG7-5b_MA50]|uniref:oligogalacturonate lyase family protein n=1 Tax=Croceibacterium sp. TMG7-5b_MA50 TaxID=3121290 RepID=UPI00322222FB